MHMTWWSLAVRYDIFRFYPTRWQMPLTMVLGATVAGATSEGGGGRLDLSWELSRINPIMLSHSYRLPHHDLAAANPPRGS